jgi:phosphatidate cytidylyltransferase
MTRVLTAVVLLPIVLGIVWFLPPIGTVVLAAATSVAATVEFAAIAASLSAPFPRVLVACAVGAACVAVGLGAIPLEAVLLGAMVLIGAVTVATRQPAPSALHGAAAAMLGIAYIGVPLGAVAAVQVLGGREAVILLVVTLVASDSAQYYAGRAFGRAPLAPAISPKKTREGAIGGMVIGTAVMTLGGRIVFPAASWFVLSATGLGVVLSGIIGDLFESLLKRGAGIKDSSALIPGHGGILDRIDSWLFAGPVYYLFVRYLQA